MLLITWQFPKLRKNYRTIKKEYSWVHMNKHTFNPKRWGGDWFNPLVRRSPAISHRIILWSQNFLTLSINKYKVVKSFFYYLDRFSRNSTETEPRIWFFLIENHKILFFFNFLAPNLISNLIDHCSQLSFEV